MTASTSQPRAHEARYSPWPHRLAVVTAAATLLLIFVGGLVTNTGSALAVPDWPTTFGYNMFLYPWSSMVGGIFYEHSHRLIGSAVGILTLALALSLWLTETRRWLRVLGLVAVVAVTLQGVLGGLRVVLLEHGLAIVHGCLAQAFLGLIVSIAVCTSRLWHRPSQVAPAGLASLRALALITPPLVYLQIVVGALLTHTGAWLPAHVLLAGTVTLLICLYGGRVVHRHADRGELRRPALLLLVLLSVQLSLGLGAYLWHFTDISQSIAPALGVAVLTTHRLSGAGVWALSVVLSLRVLRLLGLRQPAPQRFPAAGLRTTQELA
jgi:cytochrome c oxidase assembly protein subunit 15